MNVIPGAKKHKHPSKPEFNENEHTSPTRLYNIQEEPSELDILKEPPKYPYSIHSLVIIGFELQDNQDSLNMQMIQYWISKGLLTKYQDPTDISSKARKRFDLTPWLYLWIPQHKPLLFLRRLALVHKHEYHEHHKHKYPSTIIKTPLYILQDTSSPFPFHIRELPLWKSIQYCAQTITALQGFTIELGLYQFYYKLMAK